MFRGQRVRPPPRGRHISPVVHCDEEVDDDDDGGDDDDDSDDDDDDDDDGGMMNSDGGVGGGCDQGVERWCYITAANYEQFECVY